MPASAVLQELHDSAPADQITLAWLTANLRQQSYGLLLLLAAIIAAVPGISLLGCLLLLVLSAQMTIGRPSPLLPGWIAGRALPAQHLRAMIERSIPMLRQAEKIFHPRYSASPEIAKRVVGSAVLLLTVRLLLNPLPLSGIVPAVIVGLIALAYLEEDGLMLSVGLLAGAGIMAAEAWAVVEMVGSMIHLFSG